MSPLLAAINTQMSISRPSDWSKYIDPKSPHAVVHAVKNDNERSGGDAREYGVVLAVSKTGRLKYYRVYQHRNVFRQGTRPNFKE